MGVLTVLFLPMGLCLIYVLIGLPIKLIPISPENPIWLLVGDTIIDRVIRPVLGENRITRFMNRGWVVYEKYRVAMELGDCFTFVTPDLIWVFICDPDVLVDVLQRRHDFLGPLKMLSMLNPFGPNVATVEGAEWQRHRKITNVPFNDANNKVVWSETVRQATQVLHLWMAYSGPSYRTAEDVKTLTLHVLSAAAFGKTYSFGEGAEPPKVGSDYSYRDSLAIILNEIMIILLLGPRVLSIKFLPTRLSRIGRAIRDFKSYMEELYVTERQAISDGRSNSVSIMASLIRASENADSCQGLASSSSETNEQGSLSKSEIEGNTFVYNFAGHDTTAITLAWAIYRLAAHPEVQDWISEEINKHCASSGLMDYDCAALFPKLKRCQAILYETLRLSNPLPGIIKSTGSASTRIRYKATDITLPARARVILNTDAIHTHPKYWGPDSMQWRPHRWISHAPKDGPTIHDEVLLEAAPGTYAPFSGGARVCPGKKLAQIEFVAAIATLFKAHRVEPVPRAGETMDMARDRATDAVKDSGMVLLLQMLHSETVGLKWTLR